MRRSISLGALSSLLGIAILLGSASASSAQLILNGDFEGATPPVNFGPGWTHTDPSGLDFVGVDVAFAHGGTHYVNLATGSPDFGSLSQSFTTTAGASYTLSFWLAHDVTTAASNSFQILFNSVVVFTLTPDSGSFGYTNITVPGLVAGGPSSTIEFRYQDNDDFFRLDDVAVVPEPATTWLAFSAVAIVGLVRYQRARRGPSARR